MQSKVVRKRPLWALGIWLGVSLCALLDAAPTLARPNAKAASPGDVAAGPLPSRDAASHIRALGGSKRPAAWVDLANLSLSPEVTDHAQTLILAVRTLARAPGEPNVERALRHLFLNPTTGDRPPLRELARAIAAQALAFRRDAESLRTLMLLASGPPDRAPELQVLAREALRAHPPGKEAVAKAFPWLDAKARSAQLTWVTDEHEAKQQRKRERCEDAKRELPRLAKMPPTAAAAVLSTLASCPSGRGPSPTAFERLADSSPTWALRGMAALGLGQDDSSWQARAEAALARADATQRSAAAWFLAVQNPDAAERLARDGRREVRAAAVNQIRANQLASAPGAAYACPAELVSESTHALFQRFSTDPDGAILLGCLASRVRQDPGPGLTSLELSRLVDSSPALSRLLVATGLGEAAPGGRALASGLAQRLFASEADDFVRRFLCLSLERLGLAQGGPLAGDLQVDPDPVCRAVADGSAKPAAGNKALSTVTTRKLYPALRTQTGPLWLEPAPDGFVGARDLSNVPAGSPGQDFVDCRETGAPVWACGPTALTPG